MSALLVKRKVRRVLLYVVLIALLIVMVFPMLVTVLNSFFPGWEVAEYKDETVTDKSLKLIPSEVTLEQYDRALIQNHYYWSYFWNSVILTIPIVIGQIIVSVMAAYAFTVMKNKFKEVLFFIYMIVMLLPFQVTLVPAYITANTLGIMDTRWAVILPGIFSVFGVFLLRQHMSQIPKTLFEAARIDGAGHWKTFWHVAMPMCKTGIAALAILTFIDNWNMVEQPLIFLKDTTQYPLSLYFSQINSSSITIAFAASVVYMIPIILVFLNGEKYLVEGVRLHGIK